MMKLLRRGWKSIVPDSDPLKYIGKVVVGVTETIRHINGPDRSEDHFVTISLYMSDKGRRSYRILGEPTPSTLKYVQSNRCECYQEVLVWMEGGNFPKNFYAEEDPLREMLIRMVDKRLMGDE